MAMFKAKPTRNLYRRLVIELHARNSSSVLAITHQRWPNAAYSSQPQLAQILSEQLGLTLDYRSLSRQLRRVLPSHPDVTNRIQQIINDPHFVADGFAYLEKKQYLCSIIHGKENTYE